PGLITVRGLELLRECDAVVYDRLVATELVDEAPADAIRIGREPLEQEEINRMLVRLARRGLDIVRLKGADPFLFGRGGEEALAHGLIEHGRAPSTPAAVIASGTLPDQRVVVAPLDRIAEAAEDLAPPALVVVGDVVSLGHVLNSGLTAVAA